MRNSKVTGLRIECVSSADLAKIESRLKDVWADFIEGSTRKKAGDAGFAVAGLMLLGDRAGLSIVADNVSQAARQGSYKAAVTVSWILQTPREEKTKTPKKRSKKKS